MILKPANRRSVGLCAGLVSALLLTGTAIADSKAGDSTDNPPLVEPSLTDNTTNPRTGKPFMGDVRNKVMEDLLRMREFFDTNIPGTLKKYKLVFSFSPRSADIREGEYIRMATTLRYGLASRWELYGGVTPFIPNPINNGDQHRWGTGETKLGVRYDWGHWGTLFDAVTIGLEGRTPLGKPPPGLGDPFSHVTPSIATSRPLPFSDTKLYINLLYDRAFDAPFRAGPPAGTLRRHAFIVSPSVLYKPGEFGGFVSYSWRLFHDDHVDQHYGHEIKAGPVWDVPLWRTQSWGLPGKWQVELAGRLTTEQGQPTSKGISVRVGWRSSFHEVFSKKSYQRKPHSE